jgi:Ser/Thr protein kinase RdoA (MazF antagonist)
MEAEELRWHLAERYGFRAHTLFSFDQDVVLLRRDEGPSCVARAFGPQRPRAAVEGDAAILRWLAEQHYPAERCAVADPVSTLRDCTVLVTEAVPAVPAVPRAQRRQAIKDAGGIRGLGELLGRLHTLPLPRGSAARSGGAWHHAVDGSPVDELAAAGEWLEQAQAEASFRDVARLGELAEALEFADGCDGLPVAFTHPDFVLRNVVATPDPAMVLVDWAGAGVGPRLSALAFLLWAEGGKDMRRVDLALAGYSRHVQLTAEELARMEAAITARPMVLDIWRLRHRGLSATDAVTGAAEHRGLARAIAERVRQLAAEVKSAHGR